MPPLSKSPQFPISPISQQVGKEQLYNIALENVKNTNFEPAGSDVDDTYYDASEHFLGGSANPNLTTSTLDLDNSTTPTRDG